MLAFAFAFTFALDGVASMAKTSKPSTRRPTFGDGGQFEAAFLDPLPEVLVLVLVLLVLPGRTAMGVVGANRLFRNMLTVSPSDWDCCGAAAAGRSFTTLEAPLPLPLPAVVQAAAKGRDTACAASKAQQYRM